MTVLTSSPGPSSGVITPTASTPVSSSAHSATVDCVNSLQSPKEIQIPTVWTEHTQKCLAEKQVDQDVRKEIIHTLSIMLTAAFKDPVILAAQCERAANGIIIQYPFLADPYGSSQSVSIG